MSVKLLAEHNVEFLGIKGGCKGSSESTLVKIPHRWKSNATPQFQIHQSKGDEIAWFIENGTYFLVQVSC